MWKQTEHYKQFDDYLETVSRLYPNKDVIAGVYVRHSRQVPIAASVHHIIERAIDLYAKGRVNGLLIFSAICLCARNQTGALGGPRSASILGRLYYPLGEGMGAL